MMAGPGSRPSKLRSFALLTLNQYFITAIKKILFSKILLVESLIAKLHFVRFVLSFVSDDNIVKVVGKLGGSKNRKKTPCGVCITWLSFKNFHLRNHPPKFHFPRKYLSEDKFEPKPSYIFLPLNFIVLRSTSKLHFLLTSITLTTYNASNSILPLSLRLWESGRMIMKNILD